MISIASVALLLDLEPDGSIADIRITVGACSEVPTRLAALEAELRGETLRPVLAERVTPAILSALAPIDDVRGSAAYRLDAARILVKRALSQFIGQAVMEVAA